MNLPNFVNFEPFNKLRRDMRASKLGRFELPASTTPDSQVGAQAKAKPKPKPKPGVGGKKSTEASSTAAGGKVSCKGGSKGSRTGKGQARTAQAPAQTSSKAPKSTPKKATKSKSAK